MAADLGFDEIQYDYVRFPVESDADAADYGVDMCTYPKQQAIQDFLSYAGERLHEKECVVTADVFGTIIGSETDVQTVGQNYTVLGQTVDAISPMVYPSHYGNGVFGLKVPDANPYETVLAAMQGSRDALQEIPEAERAVVRPWLQAFTATWVQGHISYNGTQIREQIQAVYDACYEEWILWNATNRYSAEGLLGAEETADSPADQPVAEEAVEREYDRFGRSGAGSRIKADRQSTTLLSVGSNHPGCDLEWHYGGAKNESICNRSSD